MGNKNRHLQPHQQTHVLEKRERLCDWCQLPHTQGSVWNGQWVCTDCFPEESVRKKKDEQKKRSQMRKCDTCHRKTDDGDELGGRWVCSQCCGFFQSGGKRHKNKYAHFSQVDRHRTGGHIDVVVKNKPRNKPRKPKLKKVVYWVVVITDISDGKL